MSKVQATELRPGMVIEHKGEPYRVMTFQHRTPGKGNAVIQAKMRNILTGVQVENRYMSTETVVRVAVTGRKMEYLYRDGDGYVFMDQENYEQLTLQASTLEDEAPWLEENMEVTVQYVGEEPTGLDLPKMVELAVEETEPPMKGATASGGSKPARLTNGVTIKVPQFVETGEMLRVDPVEQRYVERVR
ncbi:MAG: elongation factor P [Deltaproteobacteria bacterium]|nr:elongation factor P [Deltaproteobacteria bacterium]